MDLKFLVNLAAAARSVVKLLAVRRTCTFFIIRTRIIVEELTGIHVAGQVVYYPVARSHRRTIFSPVPNHLSIIHLSIRQS